MSNLYALQIQHIAAGVNSFDAEPGFFYRVDTSGGDVTANLPLTKDVTDIPGAWLIIKKVSTADTNGVVVTPGAGELLNLMASETISGVNQGHSYLPCLRASYEIGWISW